MTLSHLFFPRKCVSEKKRPQLIHAMKKCAGDDDDECFSATETCLFWCVGARALGGDARACYIIRMTIC